MDNEQIDIDDDDVVLAEGGPLDEALLVGDAVVTQADPAALVSEQDLDALFGEDEDEEDLGDDLDLDDDEEVVVDPGVVLDHAFELPEAAGDRVTKLEGAVKDLAGEAVKREQRRVRRKVTAATGGAGAIGCLPILLQLAGALDMDPEVASTVAAAAAALGALVVGYLTPERPLPPTPEEIIGSN
jgi:hypothetical protein